MASTEDIAAALAAVSDDDLRSLHAGLPDELDVAPGLIGWLETAADWEIERRCGRGGAFPDPCCIGDESEAECGRVALAILHASIDDDDRVSRLFDVIAEAFCALVSRASPQPT